MEIGMGSEELGLVREAAKDTGRDLASALISSCEGAVEQMPFMPPEQHQAILIILGLGILAKAQELGDKDEDAGSFTIAGAAERA